MASWQIWDAGLNQYRNMKAGDPLPTNGDTVGVLNGHTITVSSTGEQVTTLTVASGGQLVISASKDLSLVGASPTASFTGILSITGTFFIGGSSPTVTVNAADAIVLTANTSIMQVQASASLNNTSSGSLKGQNNSATVRIDVGSGSSPVTLTNNAIMHGRFTIDKVGGGSGAGNFDNEGLVKADIDSGVILLDNSLSGISDSNASCSPRWQATNGSSAPYPKLQFDKVATGLAGDFYAGVGVVRINANVTTSGKLDFQSGGTVDVANGSTFTFSGGFCGGSHCTSPASPYTGPVTNACP
jgi:hypothetical protein